MRVNISEYREGLIIQMHIIIIRQAEQKQMQIPVEDQNGERSPPCPDFIRKLYAMIQECSQIVSFSEDGTEVIIHHYSKFVDELLPKYFRHNKWRSFIRQMNMYNFRKLNRGMKTYIFVNNIFKRGNHANYHRIRRKINTRAQDEDDERSPLRRLRSKMIQQCEKARIGSNPSLFNCIKFMENLNPKTTLNLSILGGAHGILNQINAHKDMVSDDMYEMVVENGQNQKNTSKTSLGTQVGQQHVLNNPQIQSMQSIMSSNLSIRQQRPNNNNILVLASPKSHPQDQHIRPNPEETDTNSLIYFIQNMVRYRSRVEEACTQTRQNIEHITKERKTADNKNILTTVKDSILMIEEVSSKFKDVIAQYLQEVPEDGYEVLIDHDDQGDAQDAVGGGISMDIPIQQEGHKSESAHRQGAWVRAKANNNQRGEIGWQTSVQLIIPQPISSQGLEGQGNGEGSADKLSRSNSQKAPGWQVDGHFQRSGAIGSNGNRLGVSSLCSFTSVTHLINFDK